MSCQQAHALTLLSLSGSTSITCITVACTQTNGCIQGDLVLLIGCNGFLFGPLLDSLGSVCKATQHLVSSIRASLSSQSKIVK